MKTLSLILALAFGLLHSARAFTFSPATVSAGVVHTNTTDYIRRLTNNGGSLDISAFGDARVTPSTVKAGINRFFRAISGQPYYSRIERLSIFYGTNSASYLVPLIAKQGGALDSVTVGTPGVSINGLMGVANTSMEFGIGRSSPIDESSGFGVGLWLGEQNGNSYNILTALCAAGPDWWCISQQTTLGQQGIAYHGDGDDRYYRPNAALRTYYRPGSAQFITGWETANRVTSGTLSHSDGTRYVLWNNNGNPTHQVSLVFFVSGQWTQAEDNHFNYQLSLLQYDLNRISPQIAGSAVFWGDSITEGAGSSGGTGGAGQRYSARTARLYGMLEINAAHSGTTLQYDGSATYGLLTITNRLLDRYRTNGGEYVFVLYGTNDERLFGDAGLGNMTNALHTSLQIMTNNGIPATRIIVGSPPMLDPAHFGDFPPHNNATLTASTNYAAGVKNVVRAYPGMRYAATWEATIPYLSNPSTILDDGIHPNDVGHLILARAFINAVVLTPVSQ